MIERFHRTLKSSILCHDNIQWTRILPSVLLGIRVSYKEDIKSSSAELLYGENLHLPGEFFQDSLKPKYHSEFLLSLKNVISSFKPQKGSNHSKCKPFISKDLLHSEFVWIRKDASHTPFTFKYNGPFRVMKRNEKYFTILINGKEDTV
ncbi:uncharacterized protein LOC142230816 [Haematobia irritans]|uniref:uncharacterized protein LOC142230816 n=1 Tax=Haematobia irritans TaxID=7368 RepID=UPI003F509318